MNNSSGVFCRWILESETIHRLFRKAEQYVIRIPVVKSSYTAIRDLISVFSSEPGKEPSSTPRKV